MRHAKTFLCTCAIVLLSVPLVALAQEELTHPPKLLGDKQAMTFSSPELLKPTTSLREGVTIAKATPTVDFLYYSGQDHPGSPWSNWGDGLAADGKYYSAIGDHQKPRGTAQIYEYDPATRKLKLLVDIKKFLESSGALAADENYTSGKVHTRLDMGRDGWLYYAGHRGSTRTTNDEHGFRGERVYRTNPRTGETEIAVEFPVSKHVIPMSVLDPQRMIFYGGTKAGEDAEKQGVWFFAYDVEAKKIIHAAPEGPNRYAILAQSNGKLYWDGKRYDPQTNEITPASQVPHVRSATRETPDGFVYGTSDRSAQLWRFDIKSEKVVSLGEGAVGKATYVTTIDAGPRGRYLYYIPGGHGGGERDGTPVVQFDTRTKTRKVICFLAPVLQEKIGYTPMGTFGSDISEDGKTLYITWNGNRSGPDRRGRFRFDTCALTAIHIPESERQP